MSQVPTSATEDDDSDLASDAHAAFDTVSELQTMKALIDGTGMDFWECTTNDKNSEQGSSIIFDGCSMWNPKSFLVCQGCHKKLRKEASNLPVQWRWSATDASQLNANNNNDYNNFESLYHQWILYDIDSMIELEKHYQKGIKSFDLSILVIEDDLGSNHRINYKIDLSKFQQIRKQGARPRAIQRIDCNDYIKHENNNNNSNMNDLCPICQCEFEFDSNNTDDDMITLCDKNHYLHRSCAKLLINSNNGVRCPQCRQPMLLPLNQTIEQKYKEYQSSLYKNIVNNNNNDNNQLIDNQESKSEDNDNSAESDNTSNNSSKSKNSDNNDNNVSNIKSKSSKNKNKHKSHGNNQKKKKKNKKVWSIFGNKKNKKKQKDSTINNQNNNKNDNNSNVASQDDSDTDGSI